MSTATELAALTERLNNFIDITEKSQIEDRRERVLAAEERKAILFKVEQLHRDMNEVKPVTDMVDSLKAKITGGLLVLGTIGAVLWSGVLFFREAIVNLLSK